jgi:hypothetical protein
MKKEVSFNKIGSHTSLIGIGSAYNEYISDFPEILKMLKQTSSIIIDSGYNHIFKDVTPGKNILGTFHKYMTRLKEFAYDTDGIYMYVTEVDENYAIVVEAFPCEQSKLYHMYIDFTPMLMERYPAAGELFLNCLYILDKYFSLSYGGSHFCSSDYMSQQIEERLSDSYYHGDDDEINAAIEKILNHYNKHSHKIESSIKKIHSWDPYKVEDLIGDIDLRTGCNFPKLKKLNRWFDLIKELCTDYSTFDLLMYQEKAIKDIEAYQGRSWVDITEDGWPVSVFDIFSVSWFGDTFSVEDTDGFTESQAREFGYMDINSSLIVGVGSKIPKKLHDAKPTKFLRKIVEIITLGNEIRDSFILKKHGFLT